MSITSGHYIPVPRNGPTVRPRNEITESADLEKVLRQLYGGGQGTSGVAVSPASAMQCAVVYACVRVLSESVAQLSCHMYKRLSDGGKERAAAHPLHRLLNTRPNRWQTSFEFFEFLMVCLALRGNFYALKNRVGGAAGAGGAGGKIVEFIPLHPDCVEVKQLPDLSLQYKYTREGREPITLGQDQVWHVRGMSFNGYEGLSPISVARETIGTQLAADRHGARLWRNGARPGGIVVATKPLSDEAFQRLKEDFDSMYAGPENAGRTVILEDGMEFKPVLMSSVDAQFLENKKYGRSEIAGIYRVPLHMINDLERATFANIEHQGLWFVQGTLVPWLRRIEQSIQRDLISEQDQELFYVEFLADSLLRGDTKSRYTAHNLSITGGWKNRNEVRVQENLNRVDGLDEFLSPLNMRQGNDRDDDDTGDARDARDDGNRSDPQR